jgi:hypothetical protein
MERAEVLKTLEDIAEVGIVNYKQTDAVKEAIPLVKKQIPMMAIMKKHKYFTLPSCPACELAFPVDSRPNFCQNCGQAVCWT